MQSLFQFFARFGATLLFILLEMICFLLIIKYNKPQKDIFINSSGYYSGILQDYTNKINRYSKLSIYADSISKENARLRAELRYATIDASFKKDSLFDTVYNQRYNYISAEVISNSLNQLDNFLTINKGRSTGVAPGMGVISDKGLVGIVKNVTDHYATVISVLSSRSMISASVKDRGFFGRLVWNNNSLNHLLLTDIPKDANVSKGDTIITSGFSTMFPKGIIVGTVENISVESGTGFLQLKVKMSNNMVQLNYVYVIQDLARKELDSLELINIQ